MVSKQHGKAMDLRQRRVVRFSQVRARFMVRRHCLVLRLVPEPSANPRPSPGGSGAVFAIALPGIANPFEGHTVCRLNPTLAEVLFEKFA